MQCPTHNKKLQSIPPQEQQKKYCKVCGREATLYCKSCKYVQCSYCRICNQYHNLIKIVDLQKVKSEYYNNGYCCNSCSISSTVDDDGIWHCNQCNFDLCPKCAQ